MILLALLACAGADSEDTAAPAVGDPDYVRDPALDVDLTSASGGAESHNAGQACMHCHQAHGPGPGRFTLAGSAYRADGTPAAEGSIQAWTPMMDGGTLVVEVPIDALGNYYTTEALGLPDAVIQPVVLDATGAVVGQMPWPTESGSCNQCHTPVKRVIVP
jgi:mono/diheme cytochrome c family protein